MNNLFFRLLCWLLPSLAIATPLQDRALNPQKVRELASALGIAPDADLVTETQARWLRKSGTERWEMEQLPEEKQTLVLNWAKQNGLLKEWRPSSTTYETALLLGATTSAMQMRLNFLSKLWNEGVRFQKIVWLTGERPLDPKVDGLTSETGTESGAARLIWERSALPEEMKKLPTLFIAVPMKENGQRPVTQDTIEAWLKTEPNCEKALFVSNQPFCSYQFAVIASRLPPELLFDVVGPEAKNPSAAAILDSVARELYSQKPK